MTASEVPIRPPRPRPAVISTLRVALPAVAGATLSAVFVFLVVGALRAGQTAPPSQRPIELVAPRLSGVDDQQRPYVITARTAMRETVDSQRVDLDQPVLVRGTGGDETRATAAKGVFDQKTHRLMLSGGVQVHGPQGDFTTPTAVYDTQAGEVVGSGGVAAQGAAGALRAGSFTAKDHGQAMVYRGGVHGRINPR